MAENDNNTKQPGINRDRLALFISVVSIAGIIIICIATLLRFTGDKNDDKAMTVFTTVVALSGSWVGTILAFYFSKENFESASNQVRALVKEITPQEKLKAISIKSKMILRDKMFKVNLPAENIKLQETLAKLEVTKLGSRIPVLTEQDFPNLVVHRSIIIEYLFEKDQETPKPDISKLTLADLLSVEKWKKYLENKIVVVKEEGTLADAKAAIDEIQGCQDAFVTKGGTKDEIVTGWITNEIISENTAI